MLNVKKFDNLIQTTSKGKLDTLAEISDILCSLISLHTSGSHDKLIKRVSDVASFNSVEEIQNFLDQYFKFNNNLIMQLDNIEMIEDDKKFNDAILKISSSMIKSVKIDDIKKSFLNFAKNILATVVDEYDVKILQDYDKYIKHLTKVFDSQDIAMLFLGLNAIIVHVESSDIDKDEIIQPMVSILIFCIALNNLRKRDFQNHQEKQESANTIGYNVGRNDPCPCGSGRKYKKCCLNGTKPTPLQTIQFEEPKGVNNPLTKKEVHDFYTIWARFTNFVAKIYAETKEQKYIKIYEKNQLGQYTLTDEILNNNTYIDFRDFLVYYFNDFVDDFINDNRVSQKNIDILQEIAETFKKDKFYIFEMFENGNAIFYNPQTHQCFYTHKLLFDYAQAYKKGTALDVLLFSYKGRIISDGVVASYNIEIGNNMQNEIKKTYEEDRKKIILNLYGKKTATKIYQLKISIVGSKPPIWRRVEVDSEISFYELHCIIQDTFDWENYHLYSFDKENRSYTDAQTMDEDYYNDSKDATKFKISKELAKEKDKITYTYDFGDSWEHNIVLEQVLKPDTDVKYPRCTAGKRRGPLEDSGGIWNYNEIAQAIQNPTDDNKDILGEGGELYYEMIDPKEIDIDKINERLR